MNLGSGKVDKRVTHTALSLGRKWSFNEGQVFRVRKNFDHPEAFLEIRIWDEVSMEWLGTRRFYLRELIANEVFDGPLRFGTMNAFRPPVSLHFNTKILCDLGQIKELSGLRNPSDISVNEKFTKSSTSSNTWKFMENL